ncbi:MAG: indolepyruvate ferredoxin oxidoreductase subunit alpha [Candidatus Sericytochromatia bacterium]
MSSILAYVITSPCVDVADGACTKVCPVDCIYTHPQARQYFINPDECIDCGSCEMVCPVSAIYRMSDVPEAEQPFIAANRDFFTQYPDYMDHHGKSWT